MFGYDLSNFKNGKAFIHFDGIKDGKADYGARICINTKGEKLFELPDRDMIVDEFEDEDVAFVRDKNGLYALMDNKGEFLTDFIYNHIYGGMEEGLFTVIRQGKYGYIDIKGKEIIPCIYDECNYFSEGITSVCLNEKWGIIDYNNNTVIPFEYEGTTICYNNTIAVQKNGKWGFVNKNNDILIDFIYDDVDIWGTRNSSVCPALIGEKYGLIDRQGNVIEDFIYDDMQIVSDNPENMGEFIKIRKDDKCALYSSAQNMFLTDFIYDYIGFCSENRFCVSIDNKFAYIDTNGEVVTPLIFDGSYEFYNEGIATVEKDDLMGGINLTGELVIPCVYYILHNCNEGLIAARNTKGQEGYIDRNNMVEIPFGKYSNCSDFHYGFASVWCQEYGNVYIDKFGKILEIKL